LSWLLPPRADTLRLRAAIVSIHMFGGGEGAVFHNRSCLDEEILFR